MTLSVAAAAVGLVLALGVAYHEWVYRQAHPYSTGVSGVLIVLALACALGCFAALRVAHRAYQEEEARNREYARTLERIREKAEAAAEQERDPDTGTES